MSDAQLAAVIKATLQLIHNGTLIYKAVSFAKTPNTKLAAADTFLCIH